MIIDWYDEIDCHLETGLNLSALNNQENKIHDYIKNKLRKYWIRPSKAIIIKWNQEMGLKKEYWDSEEIFKEYSRTPPDGIPIGLFFNILVGKFSTFYASYSSGICGKSNFADIEMPIKFLRFYLQEKGYGE